MSHKYGSNSVSNLSSNTSDISNALYTAPSDPNWKATVILNINICNTTEFERNINIFVENNGTFIQVANGIPIPGKTSLSFPGNNGKIVINNVNDRVHVTSDNALLGNIQTYISYVEVY